MDVSSRAAPDVAAVIHAIAPSVDRQLARVLLDLQHAAYAVEAALIGDDRIPPLHETYDHLRSAPLTWAGAFLDDRLVGAIAWTDAPGLTDIDRLVVSLDAHRRGIASGLVRHVLQQAGSRPTVVTTGRGNAPARALYERLGFVATGEREVLPGLWIAEYRTGPTS